MQTWRVLLIAACLVLFSGSLIVQGQGRRFVDEKLVVRDTQTNLQWEKKDMAGGLHDVSRTAGWCEATGDKTDPMLCPDATSWIGQVNVEKFAGFGDWRIPTVKELATLIDKGAKGCGAGQPCIDPALGPTKAFRYWASDDPRRTSRGTVDFYAGEPQNDFARNQFHMRAVRTAR